MFHIVFTKALFTILLGVSVVSQAYAGDCAVYAAFLSDNDRHNSSGDPLKSVADVLRQDRAQGVTSLKAHGGFVPRAFSFSLCLTIRRNNSGASA